MAEVQRFEIPYQSPGFFPGSYKTKTVQVVLASDYDALAAVLELAKAAASEKYAMLQVMAKSAAEERDHLRAELAKARELLVMVQQDGWYHPLEESEIAKINEWLERNP